MTARIAVTLTAFEKLQESIATVAKRVESVDIRRFESHPVDLLVSELAPVVAELLREAHGLVAEILDACEHAVETSRAAPLTPIPEPGPPLPYVSFELVIDAAVEGRKSWSLEAVGDIAFLAGLELRQRMDRLERLTALRNDAALIGECDSALRRIRKALTSLASPCTV